jgi:hypothetical protein
MPNTIVVSVYRLCVMFEENQFKHILLLLCVGKALTLLLEEMPLGICNKLVIGS